jgi:hypothetical protein
MCSRKLNLMNYGQLKLSFPMQLFLEKTIVLANRYVRFCRYNFYMYRNCSIFSSSFRLGIMRHGRNESNAPGPQEMDSGGASKKNLGWPPSRHQNKL